MDEDQQTEAGNGAGPIRSAPGEDEVTPFPLRPIYEREGNRADEAQIAKVVKLAWKCEVVKLPLAYNLDYAIIQRGDIRAWLEIKRRFRTLDQYPDTFLSLHKVFAAENFIRVSRLPCFFIVGFNDVLGYAEMLPTPERRIGWRGRTDRCDPQDVEPVALVMPDEFKLIRGQ